MDKINVLYYFQGHDDIFYKQAVDLGGMPNDLSQLTTVVVKKKKYSIVNISPTLKKDFERSRKIKIIIKEK